MNATIIPEHAVAYYQTGPLHVLPNVISQSGHRALCKGSKPMFYSNHFNITFSVLLVPSNSVLSYSSTQNDVRILQAMNVRAFVRHLILRCICIVADNRSVPLPFARHDHDQHDSPFRI